MLAQASQKTVPITVTLEIGFGSASRHRDLVRRSAKTATKIVGFMAKGRWHQREAE